MGTPLPPLLRRSRPREPADAPVRLDPSAVAPREPAGVTKHCIGGRHVAERPALGACGAAAVREVGTTVLVGARIARNAAATPSWPVEASSGHSAGQAVLGTGTGHAQRHCLCVAGVLHPPDEPCSAKSAHLETTAFAIRTPRGGRLPCRRLDRLARDPARVLCHASDRPRAGGRRRAPSSPRGARRSLGLAGWVSRQESAARAARADCQQSSVGGSAPATGRVAGRSRRWM